MPGRICDLFFSYGASGAGTAASSSQAAQGSREACSQRALATAPRDRFPQTGFTSTSTQTQSLHLQGPFCPWRCTAWATRLHLLPTEKWPCCTTGMTSSNLWSNSSEPPAWNTRCPVEMHCVAKLFRRQRILAHASKHGSRSYVLVSRQAATCLHTALTIRLYFGSLAISR